MASESTHPKTAHDQIDDALRQWRQGDCVLGEHWFAHRINPALGLTDASKSVADSGVDLVESEVRGLMVVTQTCDLVRSCRTRPYVEVCPLVEVREEDMHPIERGYRPQFALVPALADRRLVGDLDRAMTVEKTVVAEWERTEGCRCIAETRRLSAALARKRARAALPDDFSEFVAELQSRLQDKHDRNSPEGRALRALEEIRVFAEPSWDSPEVRLTFWFIRRESEERFEGKSWSDFLEGWLRFVPKTGRFVDVFGEVTTLQRLTAADYVASDLLDLDYLSRRTQRDTP